MIRTGMIRTGIVDDEPLARQILRDLLAQDREIELVAEGDGASLAPRLSSLDLDLIFLDIEMPEVSGFDLLQSLPDGAAPVVVFVTAYNQYAVRAFEVHALDYLMKPFSDARFAAALARAKARLRERARPSSEVLAALLETLRESEGQARGMGRKAYLDRLLVPTGAKTVVIPCADIDWIEAADYYARLHCGGKSYLLRESLASLEQKLDPAQFFRVHRSAIVQLDRILEIHPHVRAGQILLLRGGAQVAVGAARVRELQERLGLP